MPRWIRISLKVAGILAGIVLIVWLGLAWYISRNKEQLVKTITERLNNRINGDLKMGKVDIVLLRSFPDISVSLQNVSLRDSLWHTHRHDLINAKYIFAEVSLKSVIKGKPDISRLVMEDGNIYLYTDSTDYSNTSVFRKDPDKKKKGDSPDFGKVLLENVKFNIEHEKKFKLFQFDIRELKGEWDHSIGGWEADLDIDIFIKNFCFNSTRGSFMKDQDFKGLIRVKYDEKTKVLSLKDQPIDVGVTPIRFSGDFDFSTKPAGYSIEIASDKMLYKHAVKLMTPPIAQKLKMVDLKNEAEVRALLIGKMKYRDTPWVRVYWKVEKNTLVTPAGDIENTSFTGVYDNQLVHTNNHKDDNSYIRVNSMRGDLYGITFYADSLNVVNLIRPVLSGRFRSKFELTKLNNLVNGNTFQMNAGTGQLDVIYKGGLNEEDTTTPSVKGHIQVSNAAFAYVPRNLNFTNCAATIQFAGSDLYFKNVKLKSGTSTLNMTGSILQFMDLYYKNPEKMIIDWHITSPNINLNDFRAFLATRGRNAVAPGNIKVRRVGRFVTRLNTFLDVSNAHLNVKLNKLQYKRFAANNIQANVILGQNNIAIDKIDLQHANGKIKMTGEIATKSASNPFKLKADIAHVNVQELFYAFDNFGQDAILSKNLAGQLSATADIGGNIRSTGEIVPLSLNGECRFHLTNGAIVNFEPFEKIGKILFRKRNLSNVTFEKLENRLYIRGDKIIIPPMQIASSALNVFLEGTYGLSRTGTDINMEIPLRNPRKDELESEVVKQAKSRKGIVLYLEAVSDEDGKVKIKWNTDGKRIEPVY